MASKDPGITISIESRGEIAVLAVGGVIDLATGPALREAVDRLTAEDPPPLVIDLSKVRFMSSTALAILASTHERLCAVAGFAVVANSPATRRPIQVSGLDSLFTMYPTLDEALTHVRHGQLHH